MKPSYQLLKEVFEHKGIKQIAAELNISTALLYKWCEQPVQADQQGSGTINPLDRVKQLVEITQDDKLLSWICQCADGSFVKNVKVGSVRKNIVEGTQNMITEFSDTLKTISKAYEDDNQIDTQEAQRIREEWEELKGVGEAFVRACETGKFSK
jgi:hypothetical protein